MDKRKQFNEFYEKLKSGDSIEYEFSMDLDWVGFHGCFEEVNGDWIEGVTERFIDGDDGHEVITFVWKFDKDDNFVTCIKVLEDFDDELVISFEITDEYWSEFEEFFLDE